jgi:DNA-binding NarL/FixJ family response regulator
VTVPLKTRIVLADDHAMVRRGLRLVLDAEPDMEVIGEAGDGAEAVEVALRDDPHLLILDVSMPRLTGLQAARELSKRKPELRMLMLSMHDNERYFFEALRAGASGYVLKSSADRSGEDFAEDPLTPRETEIVKLVAEGHTSREIAEALVISEKTVERHRANILEKLGMRDRVELTRYAIRTGLAEP